MGKFEKYNFEGLDFLCRHWETSRAWGHEVFVIDGAIEVAHERVRYYNRTWEAYTFQSAMYGAICNYEKTEIERFLNSKKIALGLKGWDKDTYEEYDRPFKRGQKKALIEEFKQSEQGKRIQVIKDKIMQR